jgi:hypothetical protein
MFGRNSVLQGWVMELTLMQQSVILTAIRGPDNVEKYHPMKYLLRWYRRCVLLSAMDGRVLDDPFEVNGGSFTGPSLGPMVDSIVGATFAVDPVWERGMDRLVDVYLRATDALPHHFMMHFMHAVEIVGYKHSDPRIRRWWNFTYCRLVNDLHLRPESEADMDERLGDSRDKWLKHADKATVE